MLVLNSSSMLTPDLNWFETKYQGQTDNANNKNCKLDTVLGSLLVVDSPERLTSATTLLSFSQFQRNIDHSSDDGRSISRSPCMHPFVYDSKVHVAEKEKKENYLGDSLEKDVSFLFSMELIESFKKQAKGHMNDGNYN